MSDENKERIKKAKADALKVKIAKSKYVSALKNGHNRKLVLSINDPNDFTSFELAGNALFVGAVWDNNRVTEMKVVSQNGGEKVLAALNSRTAPSPQAFHPDLTPAVRISDLSTLRIEFTESEKDAFQNITLYFRLETVPNSNLAIPADVILPKGRTSATLMNFTVPVVTNELTEHLDLNKLYYSQQIWLGADPATLTMQFADLEYDGKRLIEYMDPTPVSATANYLVFRWNDELNDDWVKWKADNADMGKVDVDLVALPTGGVFAEAVLGRFNSAEKLDITRFWNWQDSPIPVQAPDIAAIQAGQREIAGVPQIGSLEAPVVSIQNPQPLPDPQGMSAILSALATSNMFRDMSGAAAGALLAQAALQNSSAGASNAANQAGANLANTGKLSVEALKTLMPLIMAGAGAALGVPIPPNLGNSSASTAGALINHGRDMDGRGVGGGTPSGSGSGGSGGGGFGSGGGGGASSDGTVFTSGGGGSAGGGDIINAARRGANESAAFANTVGATAPMNASTLSTVGLFQGRTLARSSRVLAQGDDVPGAVVRLLTQFPPIIDQPVQDRFGTTMFVSTGDFINDRLILWPKASELVYLEGDTIFGDRPDLFFEMLERESLARNFEKSRWILTMAEVEAELLIGFTAPLGALVYGKGIGLLAFFLDSESRRAFFNAVPKIISGLSWLSTNAPSCLGCIVLNVAVEAIKSVPSGFKIKDFAYMIGRMLFTALGGGGFKQPFQPITELVRMPLSQLAKAVLNTALVVVALRSGGAAGTGVTAKTTELAQTLQADSIPTAGNIPCIENCLRTLLADPEAEVRLQELGQALNEGIPLLERLGAFILHDEGIAG